MADIEQFPGDQALIDSKHHYDRLGDGVSDDSLSM
jgi:hypothetical protein